MCTAAPGFLILLLDILFVFMCVVSARGMCMLVQYWPRIKDIRSPGGGVSPCGCCGCVFNH